MNFLYWNWRLILRNKAWDLEGFWTSSDPRCTGILAMSRIQTAWLPESDWPCDWPKEEFGIGRWAVVEKSSNEFAGWCGLNILPSGPPIPILIMTWDIVWSGDIGAEVMLRRPRGPIWIMVSGNLDLNEIYAAAHLRMKHRITFFSNLIQQVGKFYGHGSNNNWYVLKNKMSLSHRD